MSDIRTEKLDERKAFFNHRANGFYLIFPNGNALSTIWGIGSYSENHDKIMDNLGQSAEEMVKRWNEQFDSNTVETMPSCSPELLAKLTETFPDEANGIVFGHMTFAQWLQMVNMLNNNG